MKANDVLMKFKEKWYFTELKLPESSIVRKVINSRNSEFDKLYNEFRQGAINNIKTCVNGYDLMSKEYVDYKKFYLNNPKYLCKDKDNKCIKCKYLIYYWDITKEDLK